ncbi:MAG: 50S ribosomal protein L29 [Thermosynechococcaceae cyanobacterium]
MARSKMSDLRKLSAAEVDTQIQQLKKELFDLRFQKATRQTVQPHQSGEIRHKIAQLMTLQREQQA